MQRNSELICDIINSANIESSKDNAKFKQIKYKNNVINETYEITNNIQSKKYNKEIGVYQLLNIPNPLELDVETKDFIIKKLSKIILKLMGKINNNSKILVVGLGNRHIDADSLGTAIIKKINITFDNFNLPKVMAFCPSVLGLTGIETYDIVKGVIDRVCPTHVILVDSLCASNESRLVRSIQISNTGICPGSGIGNKRRCLDKSIAKNVLSIGVPLLIYSHTLIEDNFMKYSIDSDRIDSIMQNIKKDALNKNILTFFDDLNKCLNSDLSNMIVSVKDIEECVKILSDLIAESINIVLKTSELNTK